MPIATITFNLPEEQHEYDLVCGASKMSLVLWHILENMLISKIHHSEGLSEEHVKILEDMREEIVAELREGGIEHLLY